MKDSTGNWHCDTVRAVARQPESETGATEMLKK